MKIPGFISYSHSDGKELADGLAAYLKNLFPNFEPVYDKDISEGEKIEKIKDKLRLCSILIIIITPGTITSKPVEEEIKFAIEKKMKIIPCKDDYLNKGWKKLPWDVGYKGVTFENAGELKRKTYSALVRVLENLSEEFQKSLPEKLMAENISKNQDKISAELIPQQREFQLKTKKSSYGLHVELDNGIVKEIELDRKALSIIYTIDVKKDSKMVAWFKTELMDSVTKDGEMDRFSVLVDGEEVDHEEFHDFAVRGVELQVPKGSNEVEIIGTEIEGVSYIGKIKNENKVSILPGSSVPSDDKKYLNPKSLTINVGEEVTWTVDDSAAHTITSGEPSDADTLGVLFDSGLLLSGTTFTVAFHQKGTYKYFDIVHPWIKGEINVK